MADRLPILAKQQFGILGKFGRFETISGGKVSAEFQKYFPAGAQFADTIQGVTDLADITITRAFDPLQDAPVLAYCLAALSKVPGTPPINLTRVFTDGSGATIGSLTYESCKVTGFDYPDGKAGDSTLSFLTITLTSGKITL